MKNSLSTDISKEMGRIKKLKEKHGIRRGEYPSFPDKVLDVMNQWYIDAVIDEEIAITNEGKRR